MNLELEQRTELKLDLEPSDSERASAPSDPVLMYAVERHVHVALGHIRACTLMSVAVYHKCYTKRAGISWDF